MTRFNGARAALPTVRRMAMAAGAYLAGALAMARGYLVLDLSWTAIVISALLAAEACFGVVTHALQSARAMTLIYAALAGAAAWHLATDGRGAFEGRWPWALAGGLVMTLASASISNAERRGGGARD